MFHYDKILVPLDGSDCAESALPLAQTLAQAMAAQLVLLRVVSSLPITVDPGRAEELAGVRAQVADRYLALTAARLGLGSDLAVTTRRARGPAAKRIVQFAAENGVDLIVLASHGRSGVSRWLHGSVTTRVLRQAPCSTLVVHANQPLLPQGVAQILLPLDGSALAESAIDPALAIAEALGARLTLLTVSFSLGPLAPVIYQHHLEPLERQEAQRQLAYLEKLQASLSGTSVPVQIALAAGAAAEEILAYAEAHATDLIVLSSHGWTGVEHWAFGSIAEKVVRGARCAALIVRPTQRSVEVGVGQ